ncbi:FecR domain-containing protein [Thermodesulfobacterium sp. TA1]|uniref:FecR domain-containing protein n=1 Tax=Thermodesulfobacterium sp. TA1 TaxID=2234087 RepID=UPI001232B954|nr:FecR domain-containing protein [Thermodesulfobacterium sp. TA1]QER42514.1 FecR domain-containing protein [Thermodesulfobacterium sp. TA1]
MGCSRRIQKSIKKLRIELCKITVGRPNCSKVPTDAVTTPRGTEFVVEREDGHIIKISVIEGEVEFTDNIKNKSYLIQEGYEAIINLGETITIRKIENLERWWEK